jgi:hypothetical protein
MRYLKLKTNEIVALELIHQDSQFSLDIRRRAACFLMSSKGFSIDYLARYFNTHRRTIEIWLNNWDKERLNSLQKRTGKSFNEIRMIENELNEEMQIISHQGTLIFSEN